MVLLLPCGEDVWLVVVPVVVIDDEVFGGVGQRGGSSKLRSERWTRLCDRGGRPIVMGIMADAVTDDATDTAVVVTGLVTPVIPSGSTSSVMLLLSILVVVVVFRLSIVDDDSVKEVTELDDDFIFLVADRSSARLAQYNIFSACKRILSCSLLILLVVVKADTCCCCCLLVKS
jgi:hypothetical protein